jgi:ADP-heptose:LPS heptosyltransferase
VRRRVLLLMDDCGAGDALRLSGHVRSVRHAFPGARIRMVASAGAASVYRGSPDVDEVIESRLYRKDSARWKARLAKTMELVRLAIASGVDNDLVITFWWGSRVLTTLARLTGRGRRIGYDGEFDFGADEMVQNARLLEKAGITHDLAQSPPGLAVTDDLQSEAHRLLRSSGWDGSAPIAVLHTGSDWACQQWSPSGWAEVGDAIVAEYGACVVFTGTGAEKDYVRRIRAAMHEPSVSVAGETSMALLSALLRSTRLVVTVDSAAYVVARSQGVPAVVLAGPSHPERLSRPGAPVRIVKRMTQETAELIDACKRPRFPDGGCHDYSCPLAGLRELGVADVLGAVRSTGALESRRAAV